MAGVLAWGWYVTDREWIPIVVDSEGRVRTVAEIDHLNDIGDVFTPAPTDECFLYWDAPNSRWACRALVDEDMPLGVLCRAYLLGDQLNLVNGVWTKILLDAESYDIGGDFDIATNNRFDCPKAGYYRIKATGHFVHATVVADKYYGVAIRVNDVGVGEGFAHASTIGVLSIIADTIQHLAFDDYVEMFMLSAAGVNTVDVQGAGTFTNMEIELVLAD